MKKLLIGAMVLVLCLSMISAQTGYKSQGRPSHLKLASWNIRIFSKNRTDAELRQICKVASQFDFIAILELSDEEVLQRMIAMLKSEFGRSYSYHLSPYVGSTRDSAYPEEQLAAEEKGRRELYAFVYDSSFITPVGSSSLFEDSTFFRYPYYGTFRAGNFDFTIIAIHVIWGNTVAQRRKEINQLAQVYQTIQNSDPHENDVILVGDFNRDPDDDLAWGPVKSIASMLHLFADPEKSMIWDSHLYDNIWFQSAYLTEFTLDRGIIRFDESDFGNDDDSASKAVSDHRPVWGLFRIDSGDDDG